MCHPIDGEKVIVRHDACGDMQEMQFERGEPTTYEHPGTSDQWATAEPICCELAEGDTQLETSAYDSIPCTGCCIDPPTPLVDLPV